MYSKYIYIYHFLYNKDQGKEGHNEKKLLFFNVLEMCLFCLFKKVKYCTASNLIFFLWKVSAYMCICTHVYWIHNIGFNAVWNQNTKFVAL